MNLRKDHYRNCVCFHISILHTNTCLVLKTSPGSRRTKEMNSLSFSTDQNIGHGIHGKCARAGQSPPFDRRESLFHCLTVIGIIYFPMYNGVPNPVNDRTSLTYSVLLVYRKLVRFAREELCPVLSDVGPARFKELRRDTCLLGLPSPSRPVLFSVPSTVFITKKFVSNVLWRFDMDVEITFTRVNDSMRWITRLVCR